MKGLAFGALSLGALSLGALSLGALSLGALSLGACRRADPGAAGSAAAKRIGLSATGERRIAITITADGFVPPESHVTVGEPVALVVTRME